MPLEAIPQAMFRQTPILILSIALLLSAPRALYADGYIDSDSPRQQQLLKYYDSMSYEQEKQLPNLRGNNLFTMRQLRSQFGDMGGDQDGAPETFNAELGQALGRRANHIPIYDNRWFRFFAGGQVGYQFSESPPRPVLQANAMANPLLDRQEGLFLGDGHNGWLQADLRATLGKFFTVVAQPLVTFSSDTNAGRQDEAHFRFRRLYGVFKIKNTWIEAGRNSVRWGIGRLNSMMFAGNNEPLPLIRIRTAQPIILPWIFKFLGPSHFEAFGTYLEENVPIGAPYVIGSQLSFQPVALLEIGLGYTVQFGGEGAPSNNPLLYFGEFFSGETAATNRNFTLNARYRFASVGIEPYTEFYFEDCCNTFVLNPRDVLNLVGVHFDNVGGDSRFDTTVEWVRTNHIAYRHATFNDGFVHRNRILGASLGPDGMGLYWRGRYWLRPDRWVGLRLSIESRGREGRGLQDQPIENVVPSYERSEQRFQLMAQWTSRLLKQQPLWLNLRFGFEHVGRFNFEAGADRQNVLAEFVVRQEF